MLTWLQLSQWPTQRWSIPSVDISNDFHCQLVKILMMAPWVTHVMQPCSCSSVPWAPTRALPSLLACTMPWVLACTFCHGWARALWYGWHALCHGCQHVHAVGVDMHFAMGVERRISLSINRRDAKVMCWKSEFGNLKLGKVERNENLDAGSFGQF